MNINKRIITLGSLIILVSIILGAFGAHGLKNQVDSYHIEIFNKGVQYQFYHGIGLVILGILSHFSIKIKWPTVLFILGIIFFSGSLYILSISPLINFNMKWVGPITPIGGLCYIIGWSILTRNILKS